MPLALFSSPQPQPHDERTKIATWLCKCFDLLFSINPTEMRKLVHDRRVQPDLQLHHILDLQYWNAVMAITSTKNVPKDPESFTGICVHNQPPKHKTTGYNGSRTTAQGYKAKVHFCECQTCATSKPHLPACRIVITCVKNYSVDANVLKNLRIVGCWQAGVDLGIIQHELFHCMNNFRGNFTHSLDTAVVRNGELMYPDKLISVRAMGVSSKATRAYIASQLRLNQPIHPGLIQVGVQSDDQLLRNMHHKFYTTRNQLRITKTLADSQEHHARNRGPAYTSYVDNIGEVFWPAYPHDDSGVVGTGEGSAEDTERPQMRPSCVSLRNDGVVCFYEQRLPGIVPDRHKYYADRREFSTCCTFVIPSAFPHLQQIAAAEKIKRSEQRGQK